ncbi:phenylalanine--tRNA ligase subunit alpha [Candidatus Roizmanbacteria bacterium CG10_big_fil_rev_8_21_14_0_10_45_7]|uniref:Phenylalanine--tRNA ligase alpha subunit n=1 Tax=Candidatus Roizmanbacteria bacterium CG10_big_fil_rev_8_21_14_0_10_45_7 TaxID=1974854 RepID=A0A2M8KTV0_9BACT|nr:MAG: phenylalanine--tRNA ligase subunit alpha [Candidatus Roizmanbacteria bacterium CG10_big_fil_rev_8_21_14_0_10_45_7]
MDFDLARQKIENAQSRENLIAIYNELFGKNGSLTVTLKELKNLSIEERKERGSELNIIKRELQDIYDVKWNTLSEIDTHKALVDVTLPGERTVTGDLHLTTKAIDDIRRIFQKIGFYDYTYHEVEWEYFSFDTLNMGPTHPARDDFETFFVRGPVSSKYGRMVMSPHTSSGQAREMLRRQGPPIRMISIAKCYRPNWDASHTPMFHQFEGLCVDKDITINHLKGTIAHFVREYYGSEVKTRLRPYHFQFTEPSFEVDITCSICNGTGMVDNRKCKVCKSGWLELGGAGMVHPHVLRSGNIDPDIYSGWAFGIGIERILMMRGSIEDMRPLYEGNVSLYYHNS